MDVNNRLTKLKQILENDPGDFFSKYALGLEFMSVKDFPETIRIFEEIISANPNYHPVYYQLGKVYEANGDYDKAKKIFEKGVYVTTAQGETHAREELMAAIDELI